MVSITTFLGFIIFAFIVGAISGRVAAKDDCDRKVNVLLKQLGMKEDENNGDA